MMRTLQKLALDDALAPAKRQLLVDWMLSSTTGAERIRAGVPADWKVADKTGSGGHGSTNTIAVLWPPGKAPIVIAVYSRNRRSSAMTWWPLPPVRLWRRSPDGAIWCRER